MATMTMTHAERVQDFLAQKRIAISGLSRNSEMGASAIYKKMKDHGYEVFALHPEAESIQGVPCYPNLAAIPGGVDAVFIMNSPDITEKVVHEAVRLGIKRVWMHNNTIAASSVSDRAVDDAREHGVQVISVGCPMMFIEPDFFHACVKGFLHISGRMPR